ncbi:MULTISPECIES: hypothetical protein [Rhizobium]|nr:MULTISPECIES: hypothetical protein [Rhizobium]RUV25676.1 hypothetical protein EOD29_35300 [Mesorhizobium sp. M1A.T.Ca.IN.004.03.1.1]MBX4909770.1 hypothetical protein [Rhizobium bangladeshense]MBX5217674.1 hypothetical protein [Rhizobium sp. NLR9a]MBX5229133.1 hypothetical protein [Rhizobium sp. NLR9b]MBX5235436.1 hypothetical protein [Rhizobium sp. NLR4a]
MPIFISPPWHFATALRRPRLSLPKSGHTKMAALVKPLRSPLGAGIPRMSGKYSDKQPNTPTFSTF